MKSFVGIFFLLFCVVGMANTVIADELQLKNGDRITGKLIRMEGGKLLFKTEYAGEISIQWRQVENLTAEESLNVILNDDTAVKGATVDSGPGRLSLENQALRAPVTFALADVKAINPKDKPAVRFTARADLGYSTEEGNSDSDSFNAMGEFVARTEKNRYTAGFEMYREEDNGERTVNNWLAHGDYDHFFTKKWFAYGRTSFEHDEFADLDLRSIFGTGIGYQVFETPLLNLSFGAGPAYVDENFDEGEDDSYVAGGWFVKYDQYFFDKFVQLFHRQDGTISLENGSDWIVRTRQGLRFPFRRGLSLTLQYNYDRNNDPSVGKRKWDWKWLVLLGYEFGN